MPQSSLDERWKPWQVMLTAKSGFVLADWLSHRSVGRLLVRPPDLVASAIMGGIVTAVWWLWPRRGQRR